MVMRGGKLGIQHQRGFQVRDRLLRAIQLQQDAGQRVAYMRIIWFEIDRKL